MTSRRTCGPIFQLAVGLVLFTTIATGYIMHALLPQLLLAVAFAFGALAYAPDANGRYRHRQQVHVPKRITTILEGESLVNDATGPVALRFVFGGCAALSGSRPGLATPGVPLARWRSLALALCVVWCSKSRN